MNICVQTHPHIVTYYMYYKLIRICTYLPSYINKGYMDSQDKIES